MHRFFDESRELSKENLHHIKVLRIGKDEEFEIVIKDKLYLAKFDQELEILKELKKTHETKIPVILYMALVKGDKMEKILSQATEVGISEFFPLKLKRSISDISAKEEKKLIRWNKIIESAAKQSRRDIIPKLNKTVTIEEIDFENLVIVPYEEAKENTIRKALEDLKAKKISLVIGPEGGFEEEEIEYLKNKGAKIVTLGPGILRAETAAIVSSFTVIEEIR